MADVKLGIDLSKYPTLARFSNSDAYIRMLIGPAGSLKTSYCFNEILRLACLQEPNEQGVRPSRWVVIRNTFEVLKRATMSTCKFNIPEPLLRYTEGNTPIAKGSFLLPDGTTVSLQIDFLAVDTVDVLGKLLGYDYTGAMCDELTELDEEIILAAARRAGRFPIKKDVAPTWYGLIGATNGPVKSHWLYRWHRAQQGDTSDDVAEFIKMRDEMEQSTGHKFFELFQQPPGLLRPTEEGGRWLPNPKAENVHNLPGEYAYYFNMLMGGEQKIKAYVEGEFSDLVTGKLVFPEFSERNIIPVGKIPPLGGHPVVLGADFGRTPAVLIGAETMDGTLVILDEVLGENMSVDTLCDNLLIPKLSKEYPKSTVAYAWGDPAGSVEGQATSASPFSVMRAKNIPMQASTKNNQYTQRIDAVKWFLERNGEKGRPKLLVSEKCKYLIAALRQDYVYEKVAGSSGELRDTPTKSHTNWVSDIADALQYLCLGIRLRGERTARKPSRKPANKGKIV